MIRASLDMAVPSMTTGINSDDLAARTRRHITRRLMPFLFDLLRIEQAENDEGNRAKT